MHYLLIYDVSSDYLERRGEFRDAHLTLAWQSVERGELILGGALADPVDSAVLLFSGFVVFLEIPVGGLGYLVWLTRRSWRRPVP